MRFRQELVVDSGAVAASQVFNPPDPVVPKDASMTGRGIAVRRQNHLIVIGAAKLNGRIV